MFSRDHVDIENLHPWSDSLSLYDSIGKAALCSSKIGFPQSYRLHIYYTNPLINWSGRCDTVVYWRGNMGNAVPL